MGFGRKKSKEAGRRQEGGGRRMMRGGEEEEEGQLTLGKTRTALNLCLQKVCLLHFYGRVDHKAFI